MKNKIYLLFTVAAIFALIQYGKPNIVVTNNTGHAIFVYFSIGRLGIEPDVSEAKSANRPKKLLAGESFHIPLSLSDLITDNGQIHLGWKVNGVVNSEKIGGYKTFDIKKSKGHCAAKIAIARHEDILEYTPRYFCFKFIELTSNDNWQQLPEGYLK
ncbi:hypothetical protein [Rahnella aquatilis]|uniref:hypothetical protein n=1 Tax=Rahnella aquatilis TaxID=34038 RepID=UPI000646C995|nr:hypothetical protein [Rahnella aquatilis]